MAVTAGYYGTSIYLSIYVHGTYTHFCPGKRINVVSIVCFMLLCVYVHTGWVRNDAKLDLHKYELFGYVHRGKLGS